MLEKTSTVTTTTATAPRQTPRGRPIISIDAQNLAKAGRSKAERARLASWWTKELVDIEQRTATLAALIFDVSPGSVGRALADYPNDPATGVELLTHQWQRATWPRSRS